MLVSRPSPVLDVIGGYFGEVDSWNDRPEGSGGSELEVVNREVVGPQVGAVGIEERRVEEGWGEEPLETVVDLSRYRHSVGMSGDPDISDEELLADVDKFLVTEGVPRRGESTGPRLVHCSGRATSTQKEGDHQDEQDPLGNHLPHHPCPRT